MEPVELHLFRIVQLRREHSILSALSRTAPKRIAAFGLVRQRSCEYFSFWYWKRTRSSAVSGNVVDLDRHRTPGRVRNSAGGSADRYSNADSAVGRSRRTRERLCCGFSQ